MRWKRAVPLGLVLLGLCFVAVVEYGGPALSKVSLEIAAALKDPLNLFDERSPGQRGPRVLLSIKGPHERVLSTVRERPLPPAEDLPVFTAASEVVAAIPIIPPEYDTLPVDQQFGPPPSIFFPGSPPSAPLFPPTGPGVPPIIAGLPPTPDTPVPPFIPETPPPVTIALPEPATWAIMILGLFAIGLRRRVRK